MSKNKKPAPAAAPLTDDAPPADAPFYLPPEEPFAAAVAPAPAAPPPLPPPAGRTRGADPTPPPAPAAPPAPVAPAYVPRRYRVRVGRHVVLNAQLIFIPAGEVLNEMHYGGPSGIAKLVDQQLDLEELSA